MKRFLLLSVIGIGLLSSCSTAFKAGQTPDDVYYSPGRDRGEPKEEVVNRREDDTYQEYISSLDDRYLHMKVANRNRWSTIDNFDYWNDSRYDFGAYNYNSYNYYNNFNPYAWNPYYTSGFGYGLGLSLGYGYGGGYGYGYGWNNPACTIISYTNPKWGRTNIGYTAGSSLAAYRNKGYSNTNYGYRDRSGTFIPTNNNNSFGSLIKRVFSGTDNSTTYDRPARTFTTPQNTSTPAPTSSSAGGSSGGFPSTGTSTSTGRGGRG